MLNRNPLPESVRAAAISGGALLIAFLSLGQMGVSADTLLRRILFPLIALTLILLYHKASWGQRLLIRVSRRHWRHLSFAAGLLLLLLLNGWLLRHFSTLQWPYLWPRPGLFVAVTACVVAVWFYDQLSSVWAFRVAGLLMVFIGQSYLLHSFQVMWEGLTVTAVIHFVGVLGIFGVMVLNYVNQLLPKNNRVPPTLPAELPVVAAVIPTYNEPLPILEKTLLSLLQLDYPRERLHIVISDDGHRVEVQRLAQIHNVHYNFGAGRDAKAGNLNSALNYLAEHCPSARLIMTQDADEVVDPSFLQKTVGYFDDPQVAFVQTPKDALTPSGDPFGTRDRIFYDRIQPGRNGSGAAFSCGSGVVWRITAVDAIGGFARWNLVEDLTTSYLLHSAGYRSEYHNEILTIGLAPDDIPNLLKQRGTWAADTWRLFLFKNPLWHPGLSLRQRLQYTELCFFYVTSVFFVPLVMLVPLFSLATGRFIPIEGAALFPWMAISFVYYAALARSQASYLLRMWQYWIGHWPTYTKALWIALRSRHKKPQYKVTRKTRQGGFYGHLLWPQWLYLAAGTFLCLRAWLWLPEMNRLAMLTNIGIFAFFAAMHGAIITAAFYGVSLPNWSPPRLLRRTSSLPQ
jgi:cellulose synthase (UDP-forming)